jgi:DNA-binding response OmpR family regulator
VDTILVISRNSLLTRTLKWSLEDAGFLVLLSPSVENSFLDAAQNDPVLVIVDADSTRSEKLWQTKKYLHWFHRRCPVLLLTDDDFSDLKGTCDCCLPMKAGKDQLLSCIQECRH